VSNPIAESQSRPSGSSLAQGQEHDFAATKEGHAMGTDRLRVTLVAFATLSISSGFMGCGGTSKLFSGCFTCDSPPGNEFLYATSPNKILGFKADPTTGALSSPISIAGPNQSSGMTVTLNGHLYVSDFQNDAVLGFTADTSKGSLTAISGSPFSLGGTPPGAGGLSVGTTRESGLAYLYATDINGGTVAGFSLDYPSGMLTAFPGPPFPAVNTPVQAVQAGLQGQFLYVSNLNDSAGGISAYNIDAGTGALIPIPGSPFSTGAVGSFPGPSAMVVDAYSRFLYVALAGTVSGNNKIVAFSIDPNTGVLGAVPGSPFTAGKDPLYMVLVPTTAVGFQAFLYTANIQDNTISAFTVDETTGLLTEVSGSPYSGASTLAGLAEIYTTSGKFFLYAADQAGSILVSSIDGVTGELKAIPGSPFPTAGSPTLLTVVSF
jgi:6-phosphogluconolactonase (cycloisomerase 2 family)